MPDKLQERSYLAALQQIMPEIPRVEPAEPEPPDFVFSEGGHRLGIELTEFHLPPGQGERPHSEQQNLKDQIAKLAGNLHEEAGGPALYVDINFQQGLSLAKADIHPMAKSIAESVANVNTPPTIRSPGVEVPWDALPAGISDIVVFGSVKGRDRLWTTDAGGWVADVTSAHIKDVIAQKTKKKRSLDIAQERCDELWLVIVNDGFPKAAPAEITPQAVKAKYTHPFARLLWFVPNPSKIYELRHTEAVGCLTDG